MVSAETKEGRKEKTPEDGGKRDIRCPGPRLPLCQTGQADIQTDQGGPRMPGQATSSCCGGVSWKHLGGEGDHERSPGGRHSRSPEEA